MLLLHTITSSSPSASDSPPSGLRGQRLLRIETGPLTAWATDWRAASQSLTRQDMLAHHAMVMALGDGLPARFPSWFASAEALRTRLSSHRAALCAALERVRGRLEIGVTATWTQPSEPAPIQAAATETAQTPGRRYLLQRRALAAADDVRRARARALREALETACGAALVEGQHQVCPTPEIALASSLLVDRGMAETLRERVADAKWATADVRILVVGPWPPYTFAGLGMKEA